MSYQIQRFSKLLVLLFCTFFTLSAQSSLLLDGNFEENAINTPWSFTPTATLTTTSPISGSQSLLLSNANVADNGFIVAFQTIALDGSDFVVGDEIFLSGLAQLISSQTPLGRIFMEIAFRDDTNDAVKNVNGIDFANAVFTEVIFSSTGSELFSTPSIVIPEMLTFDDGTTITTAATRGIRIALAMGPVNGIDGLTEVLFDEVRLQKVPEPSTIALLGLSLLFLGTRFKKAS